MDINGKKALVFGGTSGIGLAASGMLASRGARVIAISRNPDRAREVPANVTLKACDVLDEAALRNLFNAEAPFDILISAATGGERATGPFLEMDMDKYRGSFDKMWGYANVVRYGTPHLDADGTIVLVSGSPARKPKKGQIAIGSVGGAVEAFVGGVAKELAPRRINVVCPGVIDTPMVPLQGADRQAHFDKLSSSNLIPRAGLADEVAQAIVFLVQNDYVTGTTVDVDGGWFAS